MALYTTPEFTRYAAVHQNPNGEGDARPTALQVINDNGLKGKLTDKTILITGCSSGLGVETARALAATGAHIFCTARSLEKGQAALADILSPGKVDLLHLDLESLASVRTFAAEFLAASHGKLDILINNAGVMAIPQSTTADGFETQFGVNHLAHFLLFQLLKPALVASSPCRHWATATSRPLCRIFSCENPVRMILIGHMRTPKQEIFGSQTTLIDTMALPRHILFTPCPSIQVVYGQACKTTYLKWTL
jgi:NAD(P)-dependent dehydrogenase (short-subunit alcohol dehydrogenase family)